MDNSLDNFTATLSLNAPDLLQDDSLLSSPPFRFFQTESLTAGFASLLPLPKAFSEAQGHIEGLQNDQV